MNYISPECDLDDHEHCDDPGDCTCPCHEDDPHSLVYGGAENADSQEQRT